MKVLVTGGAGHVGKATTERLIGLGWEVRVIGLEREIDIPGAEFANCDVQDFRALREQVRGCQAVVHLAAVRSPHLAPAPTVFGVNVMGTFNLFEAAAAEGIHRVVQASSINALGCAYNLTDFAPQYFPIDEDHPSVTTDPYSFSKEVIEDIGEYFWRRDGISSVALRFPWVYKQEFAESEDLRKRRLNMRAVVDALSRLSETERQAKLAALKAEVLEFRKLRPMEFREEGVERPPVRDREDYMWYAYMGDRFNLWAMLDERDAAQSIIKGLTADFEGAHTLFINDSHNSLGYPSAMLVGYFFPELDKTKVRLSGSEALVSIDKARALIGFEPEYSLGGVE